MALTNFRNYAHKRVKFLVKSVKIFPKLDFYIEPFIMLKINRLDLPAKMYHRNKQLKSIFIQNDYAFRKSLYIFTISSTFFDHFGSASTWMNWFRAIISISSPFSKQVFAWISNTSFLVKFELMNLKNLKSRMTYLKSLILLICYQ